MIYPFPFVALTNSFFVYSCYHIRGPSDAHPKLFRLPAVGVKLYVLANDCCWAMMVDLPSDIEGDSVVDLPSDISSPSSFVGRVGWEQVLFL